MDDILGISWNSWRAKFNVENTVKNKRRLATVTAHDPGQQIQSHPQGSNPRVLEKSEEHMEEERVKSR